MPEKELNEAIEVAKDIASGQINDGMVVRRTMRILLAAIAELRAAAKKKEHIVEVMDGGGP